MYSGIEIQYERYSDGMAGELYRKFSGFNAFPPHTIHPTGKRNHMLRKILIVLFFVTILLQGVSGTLFAQSKKVQEHIHNLNNSSSPSNRWEAAWNLGQIGDTSAVGPLVKTLADDRRYVREAAVVALGKIGDSRATEPLIKTLSGDNDPTSGEQR